MEKSQKQNENILVSIACNIVAPAILLSKGNAWFPKLDAGVILLLALAFPVAYFIYDLFRRRQANMISLLGFFGTLASGGLGLLKMDPLWIAVKEAAVPLLIGVIMLFAELVKKPLLRTFFLNDAVLNLEKINAAVASRGNAQAFEDYIKKTGLIFSGTFFFSAILNFILARFFVQTHPETDAVIFNQELGKMTLWSWPVIVLPMSVVMIFLFFRLLKKIHVFSGLGDEEIFRQRKQPENEKG